MDVSNLDKITKKELCDEVLRLEAVVGELKSQIAARDAALSETGEDGWLITCKAQSFTGTGALGLQFAGGRAFVPDRGEESAQQVRELVANHGYQAKRMTAKEFKALRPVAVEEKQSLIDKITTAQVMGG